MGAGGKARMQVDKIALTEKIIYKKDWKEMRENHELSGEKYVLDQRVVGTYEIIYVKHNYFLALL